MLVRKTIPFLLLLFSFVTYAQPSTTSYLTGDGLLSFSYPADWHIQDSGDGVIFLASHADMLGVLDEPMPETASAIILYARSTFGAEYLAEMGLTDEAAPLEQRAEMLLKELSFTDSQMTHGMVLGGAMLYAADLQTSVLYVTETPKAGTIMVGITSTLGDALTLALLTSLVQSDAVGDDTFEEMGTSPFIVPAISPHLSEPQDCSMMRLGAEAAYATNEIQLMEFPHRFITENEGGGAYFALPHDIEIDALLTYYADTGVTTLAVPLVEHAPYEDTPAILHIVDATGEALCTPQPFTIRGLPDAEGAYAGLVSLIGERLGLERQRLGLTREELHPDATSPLTAQGMMLALAYYSYDGPDNPNALIYMADGTAPILQAEAYDARLLDSLIAVSGLPEMVRREINTLRASQRTASAAVLPYQAQTHHSTGPMRVVINDFPTLVEYMNIQKEAHSTFGPGSVAGNSFNDAALANTLAGAVTGPVGVGIGAVMYTAKTFSDAITYTLPAEISEFNLDYSGDIAFEDDTRAYQYGNLRVTAKSLGWNMKYVIIDGVLMAGGLVGTGAQFTKVYKIRSADGAAFAPLSTSDKMADFVIKHGDNLDVALPAGELVSNYASRVDDNQGFIDGVLTFGPYIWEDIPIQPHEIDAPEIVSAPHVTTPAIIITDAELGEYRALNTGTSYLRFMVSAGRHTIVLSKPISVARIDIPWEYSRQLTLNEGDQICFSAEVKNAHDTRGQFTAAGTGFSERVEGDSYCFTAPVLQNIQWTTPFDCTSEPTMMGDVFTVSYESLANRGPRDPNWNPAWEKREAFSIIRVEPKAANHADATPPVNENCETFSGDWEFTLISGDSLTCDGSEPPSMVSQTRMTAADGSGNLRGAGGITLSGIDGDTLMLLPGPDVNVYISEAESVVDGEHIRVKWQLFLTSSSRVALHASGYSDTIYDNLPQDAQQMFPLCKDIAFFFVYEGLYIGE